MFLLANPAFSLEGLAIGAFASCVIFVLGVMFADGAHDSFQHKEHSRMLHNVELAAKELPQLKPAPFSFSSVFSSKPASNNTTRPSQSLPPNHVPILGQ